LFLLLLLLLLLLVLLLLLLLLVLVLVFKRYVLARGSCDWTRIHGCLCGLHECELPFESSP